MSGIRKRRESPKPAAPTGNATAGTATDTPASSGEGFLSQYGLYLLILYTLLTLVIIAYINPFPTIRSYFDVPSKANITQRQLTLIDTQLKQYDGSNPKLPIFIAINGTIYDVSAGSSSYAPGGHYHHFAGRDATRAWITTCSEPEQELTFDLRGLEEMFMPLYLDEQFEDIATGDNVDVLESIKTQASAALKKTGKIEKEERERRRKEDLIEAEAKVRHSVEYWQKFFRDNPKYSEVGRIVGRRGWEEVKPKIPLCEAARKRRPWKGGRMDSVMQNDMKIAMGQGAQDGGKGGMPEFVRQKLHARGTTV